MTCFVLDDAGFTAFGWMLQTLLDECRMFNVFKLENFFFHTLLVLVIFFLRYFFTFVECAISIHKFCCMSKHK